MTDRCVVFVLGGWTSDHHLHTGRCTGTWMHVGEYPVHHVAPKCDTCGITMTQRKVKR